MHLYTEHISNSGIVRGNRGRGKKEENDRVNNMEKHHICEGARHKETC
jgi:hypothetical protein